MLNNGQQQRTATASEQKSTRGHLSAHNGTDIVDKTVLIALDVAGSMAVWVPVETPRPISFRTNSSECVVGSYA